MTVLLIVLTGRMKMIVVSHDVDRVCVCVGMCVCVCETYTMGLCICHETFKMGLCLLWVYIS